MGLWISHSVRSTNILIIISALILAGNICEIAAEIEELGLEFAALENEISFTVTNESYEITKVECKTISRSFTGSDRSLAGTATCYGLLPCTTYLAMVFVKNVITGDVHENPITVSTAYGEPSMEVTQITSYAYSVYVSWTVTNPSCISSFNINANSSDSTFQSSLRSEDTDIEMSPLKPCSIYSINLRGFDVNKDQIRCANCVFETPTDYADPDDVTNIQFEPVNNDSIRVKWEPPQYQSCIQYYYLKWTKLDCVVNGNDEKCLWTYYNVTDSHAREYIISNLVGCEDYGVVVSINAAKINTATFTKFTSPEQTPGEVREIKLEPIESTNVTIVWSVPELNGKCTHHYQLTLKVPEGDHDRLKISTKETNAVIYDLDPCRVYDFSISAVSENNFEGPETNIPLETIEDNPGEINNVSVSLTPGQINLEWKPPSFAKYCIKEYRLSVWATDEPNDSSYQSDKVTNETFGTISSLVACQLYTVQIIPVTHMQQDGVLKQIEVETVPVISAKPRSPEATIHSHSLEVETQDVDQLNRCPILFAKFVCETDKDVKHKVAEETIQGQLLDLKFRASVGPLSPFTQYVCKVSLFNKAGWSANSSAIISTGIYYPTDPENIEAKILTNTTITYKWDPPTAPNGKVNVYQLHFRYVGPSYYQPKGCAKPTETPITTETSRLENEFRNVKASSRYSVQIAAQNDYGTGSYTDPFIVTTKPWVSSSVNSFKVQHIDGPDIDIPTYKSSVTLAWELPCQSNGQIKEFILEFSGYRSGYEAVRFTRTVPLESPLKGDIIAYTEDKLQPEFKYNVSIVVVNADVPEASRSKQLSFLAPAGIPESVPVEGLAKVDAFESSNPTTSAVVRFPVSILNSEKGDIIYAALLLSQKDCQPTPSLVFNKIDSEAEWPHISTYSEAQFSPCIRQYQTTPVRWTPVYKFKSSNETEIKSEDGTDRNAVIEYIIGTEKCSESGLSIYCNGPLRPDTNYQLVFRLFTRSGFNDAGILEFRTDSLIKIYVILIAVVTCLMVAFLAGFLYLYITKRLIWHRDSSHGIEDPTGDVTAKNFQLYYFELAKREKLQREFKELQVIAIDLSVSASRSNENKNRYTNIFPYDKNRVILDIDFDGSDYINASFINGYHQKKEYIATQGPKPETFIDFWRMILQHNVRVIVMVTQFKEGETIKCHKYFPTIPSNKMNFGNYISVVCKKESLDELYERREMTVTHSGEGFSRKVIHYYFKKWPDHDCPTDPAHLIQFVRKVKSEKVSSHSPIVVHCSAGVGRTGTFIGLDIIMQRLKSEGKINIFETIKELRFQRMKMVQTIQQYTFLYTCAYQLLFLKKKSNHFKFKKEATKGVSFYVDTENSIRLSDSNANGKCLEGASSVSACGKVNFNCNNVESVM